MIFFRRDWNRFSELVDDEPLVHYALHDTFITGSLYTFSRKDEREAGAEGAMRPHDGGTSRARQTSPLSMR